MTGKRCKGAFGGAGNALSLHLGADNIGFVS